MVKPEIVASEYHSHTSRHAKISVNFWVRCRPTRCFKHVNKQKKNQLGYVCSSNKGHFAGASWPHAMLLEVCTKRKKINENYAERTTCYYLCIHYCNLFFTCIVFVFSVQTCDRESDGFVCLLLSVVPVVLHCVCFYCLYLHSLHYSRWLNVDPYSRIIMLIYPRGSIY